MAIRDWPGVRVAFLWVFSLVIAFAGAVVLLIKSDGLDSFRLVVFLSWVVLGAWWIIPVTWLWLSGREKPRKEGH